MIDLLFNIGVKVDPHYVWDKIYQPDFLIVGFEYSFKAVIMSTGNGQRNVDVEFVTFGDDFFELIDEVQRITEFRG